MQVIIDHNILDALSSNSNYPLKKKILSILYNPNIKFIITNEYIDHLEKRVKDKEFFQAWLKELVDANKYKNIGTKSISGKSTTIQDFIRIVNNQRESMLFTIAVGDSSELSEIKYSTLFIDKIVPKSRDWFLGELLCDNKLIFSYQDFKLDKEINELFDSIFNIPLYLNEVTIFDREQSYRFYKKIKGKYIFYYSFFKNSDVVERREALKMLQSELGGKLKLNWTNKTKLIHERKILFDGIIVTLDNSCNNITCDEPTWEITVSFSREKSSTWKQKCAEFRSVSLT